MSAKLRMAELEPLLKGSTPAMAPRDEVGSRAFADLKSAVVDGARNEHVAAKKAKKALRLIDSGRSAEGVRLAVSATEDDPNCVPAYVVAGAGLDMLGLLTPALTFMQEALRIAPNNPLIPAVLADIAKRNGDLESAEKCARIATQIDPLNWRNAATLALILRDQKKFEDAIAILHQQIMVNQEEPILWNALTAVLVDQGDIDNAKIFAGEALRLDPRNFEAMHNLGVALIDEGLFEEALAMFQKSNALSGGLAAHQGNRSLSLAHALLGAGRLDEGWKAYDCRVAPGIGLLDIIAPIPRWAGEDLRGKRLLLIGEQGLGDEIMFMTVAPDAVAALGPEGRLGVACETRLQNLFARSFDGCTAYAHYTQRQNNRTTRVVLGVDWADYDLWAPMGDLAAILRPTVASFAANAPYLRPCPERVAAYKDARAAFGDDLVVGVAWRSLLMSSQRQRYFADIEDWAAVLTIPGVRFVSLQPGDTAEEEARIAAQFGVTFEAFEGLDLRADLDGIAAASRALDLVIAPMNASSNLAAAAGAQVWFTAGHLDWSMLGARAIPWYPSSRLFLPPRPGAWTELYGSVAQALTTLCEGRR